MMSKKGGLCLTIIMVGFAGCDGTAIFIPEDNTRVNLSSGSHAPYSIHVLLDEAEHAWASDPNNNVGDVFRLESYDDSSGGWKYPPLPPPYYTGTAVYLPTGTSYWWSFDVDLYTLGIYAEPGTWGASFMFRVSFLNASDVWQSIPGLTVDWRECYRLLEAGEASCPYRHEVRLRSQYYVPNIARGKTDCVYADDACSRCVTDVLEAVDLHNAGYDIRNRDLSYEIWGGPAGALWDLEHNQGIARLADVVYPGFRVGRVVLTHNLNSNGLEYAEHFVGYNSEGIFEGDDPYEIIDSIPIRNLLNHPGGAQAHGNTLAVALEHKGDFTPGVDPYAAVYFIHFPPEDSTGGEIVNILTLDGSQGEPFQAAQSRAASAAFLKMNSGYYLTAVSGRDDGRQGIWFYESSDTTINAYTEWYYVGFWDPPPRPECPSGTTGEGNIDAGCFGGASGMALVADCTGAIYLITMHGTNQTGGDEYEWNQVWQVTQSAQEGAPNLAFRYWQKNPTGFLQTNNPAFRWAGGAYVTEDGNLAVFNTRRSTSLGNVYYSKY